MPRYCLFASLLALVTAAAPLPAQDAGSAELTITVVDGVSGAPVRDARVEVPGVRYPAFTNRNGVVRFGGVPAGNRIVRVSRLGYAPGQAAVDLPAGAQVERTVALAAEAVEVAGVSVSADRRDAVLDQRGFYRRRQSGFGASMLGEEIDRIRPQRTIDLFRRMRGFVVTFDRRGKPYLTTSRGSAGLSASCTQPLVFLDGMLVTSRMVTAAMALEMVPPEQIAAVEGYSGPATIPAEYNPTGAACGVVLIWTRTRY